MPHIRPVQLVAIEVCDGSAECATLFVCPDVNGGQLLEQMLLALQKAADRCVGQNAAGRRDRPNGLHYQLNGTGGVLDGLDAERILAECGRRGSIGCRHIHGIVIGCTELGPNAVASRPHVLVSEPFAVVAGRHLSSDAAQRVDELRFVRMQDDHIFVLIQFGHQLLRAIVADETAMFQCLDGFVDVVRVFGERRHPLGHFRVALFLRRLSVSVVTMSQVTGGFAERPSTEEQTNKNTKLNENGVRWAYSILVMKAN